MDIQFELFENLIKVYLIIKIGIKQFNFFLQSPSKEFLNQIIFEAFNNSQGIKNSASIINQISQSLEIDQNTSEKVILRF